VPPDSTNRNDLFVEFGPVIAGAGLAIAVALWIVTLVMRNRSARGRLGWTVAGIVFATGGLWFAFRLATHFLTLATGWPLPAVALLGGLAVEAVVSLYRFERSIVSPTRGRCLLALRLAALLALLLVLLQPTHSYLETREIERELAVLVDESDSMLLADQRLTASEALDRATLLEVEATEKRPPLHDVARLARRLDADLAAESEALAAAPTPAAGLENRADQLPAFFDRALQANARLTERLDRARSRDDLPQKVGSRIEGYLKRSRDGIPRILAKAREAAEAGDAEELARQLEVARSELEGITSTIAATTLAADEAFYQNLGDEARRRIDEAAATPRLQLAREVLRHPVGEAGQQGSVDESTLLSRLAEDYDIRLFRYARDVEPLAEADEAEWDGEVGREPPRSRSDLTGALDHVLENTSPESLAGVLLLSDGRHNGAELPEDGLRRLAVRHAPLSAVPMGGSLGPVDISLLDVEAPESIYLDDRVVVTAQAKIDGLRGDTVEAALLADGEKVDTVTVDVDDVKFRTELRFVHRPEEKGVVDYRVRLDPKPSELFENNNGWEFKVAVTDDRTNVLLVDGFPRWEFRYLRNLFYGRDKSVHLQYVLMNPDGIAHARRPASVPASATRPFGEAEATELPASTEEWQLFDVIMLGDVSPTVLTPRDWSAIEEAVTRRGALLVCVAGPRHMPHRHFNDVLHDLLPVSYEPGTAPQFESPEPAYHVELTSEGQRHPVTSQSTSRALNLERWASFPPMRWRFVADEMKPTAEVLAYARPEGAPGLAEAVTPDGSPGSVQAAIEQLANRESLQRDNALISTVRAGLGKVLLLHCHETWRLRYGVGDTYHHRFWGQVTRWGAGPNLRAGNDLVRLGTDKLSYAPGDPVEITAKALDETHRPLTDAAMEVEVWRGEERIARQRLSYRSDSSGLYETTLSGLQEEGEYRIELAGDAIDRALEQSPDGPGAFSTELLVVSGRNPVELAELTADRDFLERAARITGGRLAELNDLESLLSAFGPPRETLTERRNVSLWDTWPMLVAFLGLLTAEWILRRRSGLV